MPNTENQSGARSQGGGHDLVNRLQQMQREAERDLQDGALTAGYKANREQILDLLNRALASEWASFLQYWHHYFMASDIHGGQLREIWQEHAEDEYKHARNFNERINQLGGVPANSPKRIEELNPTPFEAGTDLRSMIEADLVGERHAIDFYSEIVRICGFEDSVTRAIFEDALRDENEHANELANLLFQFDASTGKLIPPLHQEVLTEKGQQAREMGGRQTGERRG